MKASKNAEDASNFAAQVTKLTSELEQLNDNIALQNSVSEGIARYMETDGKEIVKFDPRDWSRRDLNSYHSRYNGGFYLVQPIIAQYGIDGIKFLITTPPQVPQIGPYADATGLMNYQQQALKRLKENARKTRRPNATR